MLRIHQRDRGIEARLIRKAEVAALAHLERRRRTASGTGAQWRSADLLWPNFGRSRP